MRSLLVISLIAILLCGVVWADECLVGAYYYPWYGPGAGGHDFASLRSSLVPRQYPLAGLYNSSDPNLIAQHISQSLRANITFWAVSWWGPDDFTDNVFRNTILTHAQAGQLKYAILYESTGRLGSFSKPDYANLLPDFQFFAKYYFNNPNYLKVDGRPVVFIYLTRVYFRGKGGAELGALRSAHPDLYIVADDIFGRHYKSTDAVKWDAVTAYDVYGPAMGVFGSTQKALDRWADIMNDAGTAAHSAGVGLIPSASPGFNDKAIRPGHRGAPRYFTDNPLSAEGDLFRKMLKEIVVPKADPLAGDMIMITSFNEWHEDTQIEATAGTVVPTNKDNTESGTDYTQGDRYTDYGHLYLDILKQETTTWAD
ncbi:MAG: hypothetical protein JW860_13925 [Sedimentisphaerales bacterium]|nr:hypothetical protein [Sedimentisphaerales bacterium]